jgi:hypothetical protein
MLVTGAWLSRIFCRLRWHDYVIQFVGHNPFKECRDCKAYGAMTTDEWVMAQEQQRMLGGEHVLEEEDTASGAS